MTSRWHVEGGVRLDRDGVLSTVNVSPRIGTALQLGDSGKAVVRGGWGLVRRAHAVDGHFGTFFNPEPRRIRGQVRFER